MPVYTVQGPDGRRVKIEAADEATAIRGAQEHFASLQPSAQQRPKLTQPKAKPAGDVAASFALSGVPRGVAGLFGSLGDAAGMANAAGDWMAKATGVDARPALKKATKDIPLVGEYVRRVSDGDLFVNSGQINDAIQGAFGQYHRPQTKAGQYAEKTGEFIPNALGPGGPVRKLAQVVAPAFASQGAEDAVAAMGGGEKAQAAAGFVGALAGGVAAAKRPKLSPEGKSTVKAATMLEKRVPQVATVPAVEAGQLPFQAMGPKGRSLARAVANTPGPGQEIAENALREARALAGPRMLAGLSDELGDNGSGLYRTLGELDDARKSAAAPLYAEGYAMQNMASDELGALLSRPSVKKAMGRAYRIAAEAGESPEDLGLLVRQTDQPSMFGGMLEDAVELRNPSAKTWDFVKRGLDDVLETYRDKTTGRLVLDEEGGEILNTLNVLRSRIREVNPKLGEAWDAWAGPTRSIEAAKRGRQVVRGGIDPEQIAARGERFSPAELDAQRYGMARGLSDMLRSGPPRRAVNQLRSNEVLQDRLRAGWGDDASFGRFMDRTRAVASDLDDFASIDYGSRTTPLREDIDAANAAASGLGDMMVQAGANRALGQSFRSQLAQGLVTAYDRARTMGLRDETTHQILGEVLFGGRPAQEVIQAAVEQRQISVQQAQQLLPMLAVTVALSGREQDPQGQ